MSKPLEQVEADALELPTAERARLAQTLIESLDEGLEEDPTEVELAWEAEIQRRLDQYRSGQVESIPADEVFARVRARLRRDRSRSTQPPLTSLPRLRINTVRSRLRWARSSRMRSNVP